MGYPVDWTLRWGRLMSWLYLVLAIVLEVSGTTSTNDNHGNCRPVEQRLVCTQE
jgi:multidrug transporter EmrE-like cation transporter